jgi:anti-sigma regulatory factor (Ser/Thr protein kinase)
MYEGEINMVIHAGGGVADVYILPETIKICLEDHGPGIADVGLAMRRASLLRPIRSFARLRRRYGLPNMKRYTDNMIIETELGKGTKITMTVNVV